MKRPDSVFAVIAHAVPRSASRLSAAAMLLLALGGCATGPNANPRDPLEPMNREVMRFNEGVDAVVLRPAATIYKQATPPLIRTGVSNFFGNLSDAWSFVNSLLQLKVQNAADNFLRLNINTVFGLGGILDIASEMNIERHKEDLGQTLGRWGVPAGPYIVLPLLGPSTLRDTAALPIDRKADPVQWVRGETGTALYVLRAVDVRSNLLRIGGVIDEAALDKYSFTRDAYLQRRRAQIFDSNDSADGVEPSSDGEVPPEPPKGAVPGQPAAPGQPGPGPAR